MSDKKRPAGKKVDGQPRYIDKNESRDTKGTFNLYWLMPVIVLVLIIPVMIFHLGGSGEEEGAEEGESTEETADSGEESGGEEGAEEGGEESASSGDVDAEGIARDNCASCHGQDFSGAMGPALAGTSLSEDDFTTIVRDGQGSMPAFSADQVADEELTALYQFFSEQ